MTSIAEVNRRIAQSEDELLQCISNLSQSDISVHSTETLNIIRTFGGKIGVTAEHLATKWKTVTAAKENSIQPNSEAKYQPEKRKYSSACQTRPSLTHVDASTYPLSKKIKIDPTISTATSFTSIQSNSEAKYQPENRNTLSKERVSYASVAVVEVNKLIAECETELLQCISDLSEIDISVLSIETVNSLLKLDGKIGIAAETLATKWETVTVTKDESMQLNSKAKYQPGERKTLSNEGVLYAVVEVNKLIAACETELLQCISDLSESDISVLSFETVNSLRKLGGKIGVAAENLDTKWETVTAAEEKPMHTNSKEKCQTQKRKYSSACQTIPSLPHVDVNTYPLSKKIKIDSTIPTATSFTSTSFTTINQRRLLCLPQKTY